MDTSLAFASNHALNWSASTQPTAPVSFPADANAAAATHVTFPLMSPSRYGTSVAGSMEVSSIMPEDPDDCFFSHSARQPEQQQCITVAAKHTSPGTAKNKQGRTSHVSNNTSATTRPKQQLVYAWAKERGGGGGTTFIPPLQHNDDFPLASTG